MVRKKENTMYFEIDIIETPEYEAGARSAEFLFAVRCYYEPHMKHILKVLQDKFALPDYRIVVREVTTISEIVTP